jgi:transcriptional regulator with XRE-family HTH domain
MAEIEGSDELGLAVLILRRIVLGGEQRRLAAASGVRQGRISEIERGLTTPGLRTLGRLTAAMGLPPSAVDETVAVIRAMRSAARRSGAGVAAGGRTGTGAMLLRASVLEALDDYQGSIAALRRLAATFDEAEDLRMLFAVRFNLAVNVLHLGATEEARALAGEARRLAIGLGNQLDLVRVRWLEGRVAAGLGRWQESAAALQEVLAAFTAGGHALDSALAMLELAAVHAEQGRSREAGELARQAASLCEAQGVRREALAAIELVRQAAAEERLSAELAWRVARSFERARRDPGLRFEVGK